MSNRNWVCFSCRITNRKDAKFSSQPVCSECGGALKNIGYKIPIPPKSKLKDWRKLELKLASRARDFEREKFRSGVRKRHDIEREIERLKALPSNVGRASLIKRLEQELKYA